MRSSQPRNARPLAPPGGSRLWPTDADPITSRLHRQLILLSVLIAVPCAAVMALLAGILVLHLRASEAARDGVVEQRQLLEDLSPSAPLTDLQQRLRLSVAAGEARALLVINERGTVVAASPGSLQGRALAALMATPSVGASLQPLGRGCPPSPPLACLLRPRDLFLGPWPIFGGRELVQVRRFNLTAAAAGGATETAGLIAIIDLRIYRQHLLALVFATFIVGFVPMLLCTGGLLWMMRRRVLPDLLGQAHTDALSGVYNRRAFTELARANLDAARQVHEERALALIDIDHFKRVNDGYGHACGDAVIRHLSDFLFHAVRRRSDLVGRLGGDEFVLLLSTSHREALQLLERCRQNLAQEPLTLADGRPLPIQISVGVASTSGPGGYGLGGLIAAADAALYAAKNQGRDRVVSLEPG